MLAEASGVDRLLLLAGRHALLAAGSGFAVALFLGGGAGPVLPGWAWFLAKTLPATGAAAGRPPARFPAQAGEASMAAAWIVALPAVLLQLAVVAVVAVARG